MRTLPDPMIGTMLPRHYRITGKLGRGAMSMVYGGIYEPLNQPVAIKLLKSHLVSDLPTFKRFQQEAKTAGALEHPNIVGILDFGVTDQGVPYLIMELLQGESLSERLKRCKSMPVDSVISLFAQAGDALQYTHERGIIHRDVKPSNILIVLEHGEDMVKIVDFGIAKMQTMEGGTGGAAELTATGEVFGTPLYVSPEQAMGRPLDSRADIYSLGCVMYEALAGVPPFNAPTAFDVIRMQITENAKPIEDARPDLHIPPSLAVAIERAMAKDPNARYQTMAELLADLQQAQLELTSGVRATRTNVKRNSPSGTMPILQAPNGRGRVSSSKESVVSNAVPQMTLRRTLPVMPFLVACVSGCLAGVLILFCLDLKSKLEHPESAQAQGSKHSTDKKDPMVAKAVSLIDLCTKETAKHNLPAALTAGKKAVAMLEKDRDGHETELAAAYRSLGIVYYYMHQGAKAEPLLVQAWEIDKQMVGEESATCAGDLSNLAKVFEDQKKFDKAETYYRRALAICEKVYGRTDRRLVNRLKNLADFLHRQKRSVEARTLDRRAREVASAE